MSEHLVVPLRIDALALTTPLEIIGPSADVTVLPWFDGERDRYPETPNVASAINAEPFGDHRLRLDAGIHLHWAIPAALTRGATDPSLPGGVDLGDLYMPAAPNRWLVHRTVPSDQYWLVESDYVHPEDAEDDRAVAYLPFRRSGRPHVRLGRRTSLTALGHASGRRASRPSPMSRFLADPAPADRYLPHHDQPLTALGHHDPTFAAMYADCHSVFGLHDDAHGTPGFVTYEVFGWYGGETVDPLAAWLASELPLDDAAVRGMLDRERVRKGQPPLPDRELTAAERGEALGLRVASRFGWDAGWIAEPPSVPWRILCYGEIMLEPGAWRSGREAVARDSAAPIAVGSTVVEAAAAFLEPSGPGAEARLRAAAHAESVAHEHLDFAAKLDDAAHAAGFSAVRGHSLWSLRPRTPSAAAPPGVATPSPLPDELAVDLDALNEHQAAYDAARDEVRSRCQELFADWHRLMVAAYPPRATDPITVDVNALGALVERDHLGPLASLERSTGTIRAARTSDGGWQREVSGGDQSLAAAVQRGLDQLGRHLATHNAGRPAIEQLELALVPGPRYWRPNDPIVLLGHADSLPASRHGIPLNNGLLSCFLADVDPTLQAERAHHLFTVVPRRQVQTALNQLTEPPWNPMLLEWELEVRALEGANEQAGVVGFDPEPYAVDFVHDRLALPLGGPDLAAGANATVSASGFEYVAGRTVLNPTAIEPVRAMLVAAGYGRDAALLGDTLAAPLGGFHEGLLMREAEPQLEIADPLGFPAQQDLARRVRDALGNFHPESPVPGAPFHPLRNGDLAIERLRLIDTFGQFHEWRPVTVLAPAARASGGNRVSLPVRITQPARVHLRWLSAAHETVGVNDLPATSPICGWLLPNFLDGALDVYDADGTMLGLVDDRGRWRPAPASFDAPLAPRNIADARLAGVVRWITDHAEPAAETARLLRRFGEALDGIEPLDSGGHQSRALLIGRPIAVARARLDLQLLGLPAVDQSWEHLRHRLLGAPPSDHGFSEVKLPVRVGAHDRYNDGTVAFWASAQGGGPVGEPTFPHLPDAPALFTSLADPPIDLTLLLDPRAVVHVACGVLPTKGIALPPERWAPALERIAATFLTAPLLMPSTEFAVPLPAEPAASWAWLQHLSSGWVEVPERPVVEFGAVLAAFPGRGQQIWDQAVAAKILERDPARPGRAVLALDASGGPNPPAASGLASEVLDGLRHIALQIRPARTEAEFGTPTVIREGWLQLRSTFADDTT
ncbi:MAG: hypothetical protein AB7W59_06150 [Acidimicrobiia bacterium]